MEIFSKKINVLLAVLLPFLLISGNVQAGKIRIALAETPSDELAAFFIALDRAGA